MTRHRAPRAAAARLAELRPRPLAEPLGGAARLSSASSRTTGCGRAAATGWRGSTRCCWTTRRPALLVAHSLGCQLVAAWAAHSRHTRAGARRAAGGAARHRARRHAAAAGQLAADRAQPPAVPGHVRLQRRRPLLRRRARARPGRAWGARRTASGAPATSTATPAWATGRRPGRLTTCGARCAPLSAPASRLAIALAWRRAACCIVSASLWPSCLGAVVARLADCRMLHALAGVRWLDSLRARARASHVAPASRAGTMPSAASALRHRGRRPPRLDRRGRPAARAAHAPTPTTCWPRATPAAGAATTTRRALMLRVDAVVAAPRHAPGPHGPAHHPPAPLPASARCCSPPRSGAARAARPRPSGCRQCPPWSRKKPKGLGLGLEALLGPKVSDAPRRRRRPRRRTLTLDQLQPGKYQPRTRMDEGSLYELAESIKSQGVMQPILVRPGRAPAATRSSPASAASAPPGWPGWTRCRCSCKEVPDEAAAVMALIENIQREDLNPLEEAQGLQRLIDEFQLTHEQAAQAVGRSRSAASNLLRLLNLAEPVQQMLMAGDLDMGHARALLALDAAQQILAAQRDRRRRSSACATPRSWWRARPRSAGRQAPLLRVQAREVARHRAPRGATGRPADRRRSRSASSAAPSAASRARSRSPSARSTN